MNQVKLDLGKKKVLDLKKELNISDVKAQVVLALDFSGSMEHLYRNGQVQQTLERLLPIALGFDDNESIDFYLFHNDSIKVGEVNRDNIDTIIETVRRKYHMGGTNYAPVINEIVKDFKGNKPLDYPVYVIFITDGETDNKDGVERAIKNASEHGIFFQFVGIGNESFSFLRKLDTMSGRQNDNANFFQTPDLSKVSDDELYKLLLTEFPSFIVSAKGLGMIK